ncbi:UNVERIFIED_CONTAM: hypothetical protein K2H54_029909 [Gekko kuhli]
MKGVRPWTVGAHGSLATTAVGKCRACCPGAVAHSGPCEHPSHGRQRGQEGGWHCPRRGSMPHGSGPRAYGEGSGHPDPPRIRGVRGPRAHHRAERGLCPACRSIIPTYILDSSASVTIVRDPTLLRNCKEPQQQHGVLWLPEEVECLLCILHQLEASPQIMPSTHLETMGVFGEVSKIMRTREYRCTPIQCHAKFKREKAALFDTLED